MTAYELKDICDRFFILTEWDVDQEGVIRGVVAKDLTGKAYRIPLVQHDREMAIYCSNGQLLASGDLTDFFYFFYLESRMGTFEEGQE